MATQTKLPLTIKFFQFYFKTIGRIFPKHSANWQIKLFSKPRFDKVRKREQVALKGALSHFEKIGNHKIMVYEWGKGDKIAYLLHGWEGNAGSLGAYASPLSQMGYKIITFDGPAHGKSNGKTATIIDFAKVFHFLVDKYGAADLVVAHSFGTAVALYSAMKYNINPTSIALLSGTNKIEDIFNEFSRILDLNKAQSDLLFKAVEDKYGIDAKKLIMNELAKKSMIKNALLVHDKNDRVIPVKNSYDIAEGWVAAQVEIVENTGHYKMLWSPQVVKSVIHFFKSVEKTAINID